MNDSNRKKERTDREKEGEGSGRERRGNGVVQRSYVKERRSVARPLWKQSGWIRIRMENHGSIHGMKNGDREWNGDYGQNCPESQSISFNVESIGQYQYQYHIRIES